VHESTPREDIQEPQVDPRHQNQMHSTASACVNSLRPFEDNCEDKAKFHGVEKYDDWCSARDRPELGFNRCHALKLTDSFSDRLPSCLSNMRSAIPSRTLRNVPWTFDAYNELLFSRFIREATRQWHFPLRLREARQSADHQERKEVRPVSLFGPTFLSTGRLVMHTAVEATNFLHSWERLRYLPAMSLTTGAKEGFSEPPKRMHHA
jgi:hypothetical protein